MPKQLFIYLDVLVLMVKSFFLFIDFKFFFQTILDQNFYESTSKKEIEKGSGWWLYKYQNLRVGTSFHKVRRILMFYFIE